ncbi:MAG TPA: hypothetical protein VMS96_00885 [Terriglobales bacterium]|nr:hypothetical protein [Terriglobales bacterium]
MKRALHFVFVVLLSSSLLGLTGCWFKKKKPPVPQPSAQAPAPAPETPPQEQPPPAAPPQEEPKPAEAPPPKPKPKPKPNHAAAKPAPPAPAKPEEKPQQQAAVKPPRIVISEGSSRDSAGQISTPIAHDDATHQRLTTAQLLESTEANLRDLRRTLTADEQAMVAQIKDYMEQSRNATSQQDLVRARNLALKAHLLSDELVKK